MALNLDPNMKSKQLLFKSFFNLGGGRMADLLNYDYLP